MLAIHDITLRDLPSLLLLNLTVKINPPMFVPHYTSCEACGLKLTEIKDFLSLKRLNLKISTYFPSQF
jgi:hypothetical protein